ncbi:hypothetical protein Rsub_13428 [Raphidocelis subcapitata]|uniref:BZIP domain-containing protein n=1 Tax=Raphidocelis subcapitata TaxID=307507 RepID=A0A2V0PTD4_9CHLO|nr:hypothetical protein Rsub_13428 [Raphidocelis subcapitata]|eukprot:GBG00656.1 hypothetical protein Rsub_13428 [Raphidocelis subcapitata]
MAQPLTMESLMELLGARAMGAAVSTVGEVAAPLFASPLLAPAPPLAGDAEAQLALALASALAAPTAGTTPWAHAMAAPSLPLPEALARRLVERLATRLCEQPQQPQQPPPYLRPAAAPLPLPLPRLDLSQVPSATGTAARLAPGEWGPSRSGGSLDAGASRVYTERVATAQELAARLDRTRGKNRVAQQRFRARQRAEVGELKQRRAELEGELRLAAGDVEGLRRQCDYLRALAKEQLDALHQWAPPEVVSHLQARHMALAVTSRVPDLPLAAAAIFAPPHANPTPSPHCDAPAGRNAGAATAAPPPAGGGPPSPPLAAPPPAAASASVTVSGAAW